MYVAGDLFKYIGLVNFDAVTIRVVQENLMPSGDRPATIVCVANAEGVAFAHEALYVIRAETKVTVPHRVHEFFHFETGFKIAF